MKQNIFPAVRLTLVMLIFFVVIYTAAMLAVAKAAPAKGKGETVMVNGKVVGYALEGQTFNQDKYFWSRPSAAGYNAAGSSGSNKGPSNPDYLKDVQSRIDTFLVHNPTVKKEEIPSEMITASGSGLDPDISVQGANIQVARIASVRKLPIAQVQSLVTNHVKKSFFGPSVINVLKLNIALDELSR